MAERLTVTQLMAHSTIKEFIRDFALKLMEDQRFPNVIYDPDHDEFTQTVSGDILRIALGKGWRNPDDSNDPIIEHENAIGWAYKVIENLYRRFRKCHFGRNKFPVYDGNQIVERRKFKSVHDLCEEEIPIRELDYTPSGLLYLDELRDFLKLQGMDSLATEIATFMYRGYKRADVARELCIKVTEYDSAKKRLNKDWLEDFLKTLIEHRRSVERKLF